VLCEGICFGEEISEVSDSYFGAEEVYQDYVLFVSLDLR
jgi:hypothetical protein